MTGTGLDGPGGAVNYGPEQARILLGQLQAACYDVQTRTPALNWRRHRAPLKWGPLVESETLVAVRTASTTATASCRGRSQACKNFER